MAEHILRRLFQRHAGGVQRQGRARHAGYVAVHLGRLAQQNIHGHVNGLRCLGQGGAGRQRHASTHHQFARLGGHANDGKGAALAFAKGLELRERLGCNGQHIALLALVAPDFARRQARFFEWHGGQVKARAPARVVHQLREGVGEPARAHVVDRQNRIRPAQRGAVVDDFLRAPLNFGVAALHRIKVEFGGVLAGGHGARRAAAHANAHAGAAQLHQQRAGRECDLLRQRCVNAAQAAGNHDGLVVAALHAVHLGFVLAKVPQQIRPAKLVVEGRAAQRPLGHDLQRAGNVAGLAAGRIRQAAPELGHREPRQPRLGLGAAPGGAFVANLAASAGRGAGERRDGRGVVVRLDLHQHMLQGTLFFIAGCASATCARGRFGLKFLDDAAFHDRGVVRVRHHRVLRAGAVGVADHAEQGQILRRAVDGELGVEDLVAAVLAVGLRKHHQFDVRGVAPQGGEGLHQIVDLVGDQRQTPLGVGSLQCSAATLQHVHLRHRLRGQLGEQRARRVQIGEPRFGHAVVQQRAHLGDLAGVQRLRAAQQAGAQGDAVFGHALDAAHVQAAVVGNVAGLGGPGRDGAQAGRHHNRLSGVTALERLAVVQKRGQLLRLRRGGHTRCRCPMHVACAHRINARLNALQLRQQLARTKRAQGVAAHKQGQMQGHGGSVPMGRKTGRRSRAAPTHCDLQAPKLAILKGGHREWGGTPKPAPSAEKGPMG